MVTAAGFWKKTDEMYLDSAYIAKYYVNERDAPAVRELIRNAPHICSSSWALVEVTCVFLRHVREKSLTPDDGRELTHRFRAHVDAGIWSLIPISESLLRRACILARELAGNVPLRAGDALHLATALNAGEQEIWTNDRHLLAAAKSAGINGKSVVV